MDRYVVRVLRSADGAWMAEAKGDSFHVATQMLGVRLGRELCRKAVKSGGLAQLVVHGRDGRIKREFTYGEDPKRRRG